MTAVSTDYHDYVFRDGRLVGEFDAMYRHSAEVPWRQDELAYAVFSDIDIAILKSRRPRSICDVGCGLGHFTARCRTEIVHGKGESPETVGIDVSPTAIDAARRQYPDIRFLQGDLLAPRMALDATFDVVMAKDILWYVCHDLPRFMDNMVHLSGRHIYIAQSFPEESTWVGKDIIGGPDELINILGRYGDAEHTCVERDFQRKGRAYVHALVRVKK